MATTNTPQKTKNKVSEGVQPTPVDKFNFNLPGTPGYIKPSDTSITTTTTTIITTTQKNPVAPPINTNNANITRDAASNKKVPRPNQAKKSMKKKKHQQHVKLYKYNMMTFNKISTHLKGHIYTSYD